MRVHFWRRHVRDTVIILEEGNLPLPRCKNCDMLVLWRALNGRHKDTAMCRSGAERSGAERKRRRLADVELRESTEGGGKGMPGRGVPGESGDEDDDARAILEKARAGNSHHPGGGKPPAPRCENCDMLVPWRALNGRHKDRSMCRSGAERKRRRLTEAEIRESTERAF